MNLQLSTIPFNNKVELDKTLDEIKAIITDKLLDLEAKALSLTKSLSVISTRGHSSEEIESYKSVADEIGRSLVNHKNLTLQSAQSLYNRTPDNLRSYMNDKLLLYPWSYTLGGTRVVTLLSDAHDQIRHLHGGDGGSEDKQQAWVPPSSFERATHKYWVQPQNITDVMLKCAEEVPILLYGNEDALEEANANPEEDIWNTISTSITSIYFDSPKSMVLYKDRIQRVESAQLFRIRWYGSKPSDDDFIFLELKTHHEQWVQDKSVKERVSLCAGDLSKVLLRDNRKWSKEEAKVLVHNAKPNLQGKDLEENVNLLLRIRHLIIKKNLQPRVRSSYRRVAFQSNTSNALRFTIDRDIELSSEASAPLGSWCREDDTYVESVMMPVGIFEVKLGGVESPNWVHTLLGDQTIQDGHKFSKYLSGASMLYEEDVSSLPYWSEHPLFSEFYQYFKTDMETSTRSVRSGVTSSDSDFFEENITDEKKSSSTFPRSIFRRSPLSRLKRRKIAPKNRVRIEPKTYFAAERTFIQWISASLLLVTISAFLFALAEEYGDSGSRTNGVVLLVTSLFLAVYALVVYFRRLYLMKNSKPYGYTDHFAPIILTLAVLAGITSILYNAFDIVSPHYNISGPVVQEVQGSCQRLPYTGISQLEFQPSDIVIDRHRNVAIVPSNNQIISIKLIGDLHPVQVVSSLPYGDFEATVFVGGVLFAVTERSKMYAFEWSDEQMNLVGRWKLDDVKASEGIAYRGSKGLLEEGKGQLLISSYDELTGISQIHVFDVPEIDYDKPQDSKAETLSPSYHLNEKLMSNALKDAKIGSMQIFEDILYVLYDNAMSIRGFDLDTGDLVANITLPKVGPEFDKQWEGMFFDREKIDDAASGQLRGSEFKEGVKLHLALDSPPQIWTFAMLENEENKFAFPKCAAAQ